MLRFDIYKLSVSFNEYVCLLSKVFNRGKPSGSCRDMYFKIFTWLTDFKQYDFNGGDLFVFLCQLVFGCRFSEVSTIMFDIGQSAMKVHIVSLKGTQDRFLSYPLASPLIKTICHLKDIVFLCPNYKAYHRSLLKACPNLYSRIDAPHLTATHLARHFYIQVLYYVLGLSKSDVIKILAWGREDTINSYIDQNLWKNIYSEEKHDRPNTDIDRQRKRVRFSGSGSACGGTTRKKNTKKEKAK